jgi:hypothetical protein
VHGLWTVFYGRTVKEGAASAPATIKLRHYCAPAAFRREILHYDIGALRHVLDELKPALGFQVDRDRFLVGVEQQEIPGVLWGLEQQFGAAFTPQMKQAWIKLYDAVQSEMIRAGLPGREEG